MTTKTFARLSSDKRRRFLSEAYLEFSLHSFEAASITHLVNRLGIAKGSVYQYFNDKEALYLYLIDNAFEQIESLLKKTCPSLGSKPFNEWYLSYLMVYVKILMNFPAYGILFYKNRSETISSIKNRFRDLSQTDGLLNDTLRKYQLSNYEIARLQLGPVTLFQMLLNQKEENIDLLIQSDTGLDIPAEVILACCSEYLRPIQ